MYGCLSVDFDCSNCPYQIIKLAGDDTKTEVVSLQGPDEFIFFEEIQRFCFDFFSGIPEVEKNRRSMPSKQVEQTLEVIARSTCQKLLQKHGYSSSCNAISNSTSSSATQSLLPAHHSPSSPSPRPALRLSTTSTTTSPSHRKISKKCFLQHFYSWVSPIHPSNCHHGAHAAEPPPSTVLAEAEATTIITGSASAVLLDQVLGEHVESDRGTTRLNATTTSENISTSTTDTSISALDRIKLPNDVNPGCRPEVQYVRDLRKWIFRYQLGQLFNEYEQERLQQLQQILMKPPPLRSNTELGVILPFVEKTPYFQHFQLPKEHDLEICRYLGCRELADGDILFHQGDNDDKMYLILAGCLLVYSDSPSSSPKQQSIPATQLQQQQQQQQRQQQRQQQQQWQSPIGQLVEDDSFGENVFSSHNDPRSSTVISKGTSLIVYLDKNGYRSSIEEYLQVEFKAKRAVLQCTKLFSTTPSDIVDQLVNISRTRKCERNEIIIKQVFFLEKSGGGGIEDRRVPWGTTS